MLKLVTFNDVPIEGLLNEIRWNVENTDFHWNFSTKRQEKISYHRDTEHIPLLVKNIHNDNPPKVPFYVEPCYPYTKKILEWFGGVLKSDVVNAMYVKLLPGAKIHPHRDNGVYPHEEGKTIESKFYNEHDRYHYVLQGKYELVVGEQSMVLSPGDLVTFDNTEMHHVTNLDDIDRIIMIFDAKKC